MSNLLFRAVAASLLVCTFGSSALFVAEAQSEKSTAKARSVALLPHTLPVLAGTLFSPLAVLKVEVSGQEGEVELVSVVADISSGVDGLGQAQIFSTGDRKRLSTAANPNAFHRAVAFSQPKAAARQLVFDGSIALAPGVHHLWLAASVREGADIDQRISATFSKVTLKDPKRRSMTPTRSTDDEAQRMGVAVRKQGDDSAHTYRIPALVTTARGTLIAVYDIRHRNSSDLPADVDVGMSRSTDGGRTWEPMKIIMDMSPHGIGGEDDPQFKWDGIGDPSILVDRETQTVWVAATWSHGDRAWRGSQPGIKKEDTGQLMLARSDDDGVTWSSPINITAQVKKPEWSYLLQGPGKGITMKDGTLVFPAQFQDTPNNDRLPRSTIIYSRDRGTTWHIGTGSYDDTTESQVVELEPGVLMLNSRFNGSNSRVVMTTSDLGKTWQTHPSSLSALVEPRSCMASLIDVRAELSGLESAQGQGTDSNDILLFSNPNSLEERERITIKASLDQGLTWPEQHQALLDEGRGAGYSCMTMIDQDTVGILYEGSLAQLTFQRVPLADLLE